MKKHKELLLLTLVVLAVAGACPLTGQVLAQVSRGVAIASLPIDPNEPVLSIETLLSNPPENPRKVLRDAFYWAAFVLDVDEQFFALETLGEQLEFLLTQLQQVENSSESVLALIQVLNNLQAEMTPELSNVAGLTTQEFPA